MFFRSCVNHFLLLSYLAVERQPEPADRSADPRPELRHDQRSGARVWVVGDRQQRVVVVGNGSFLSNTFLGNGGNRNLGVNIVNWLSGDDNLITIQPRSTADSSIDIDQVALYLIAFSFLFALPVAFMVTGVVIWWRRRRI